VYKTNRAQKKDKTHAAAHACKKKKKEKHTNNESNDDNILLPAGPVPPAKSVSAPKPKTLYNNNITRGRFYSPRSYN